MGMEGIYKYIGGVMDVMTMRFTCIALIIVTGLVFIPLLTVAFWVRKYQDKAKWWMPVVMVVYLILFFNYATLLIPERWELKPVEVYHCEWKTNYIPKYPSN